MCLKLSHKFSVIKRQLIVYKPLKLVLVLRFTFSMCLFPVLTKVKHFIVELCLISSKTLDLYCAIGWCQNGTANRKMSKNWDIHYEHLAMKTCFALWNRAIEQSYCHASWRHMFQCEFEWHKTIKYSAQKYTFPSEFSAILCQMSI